MQSIKATDNELLAPNAGKYYEALEKDLWSDGEQNHAGG
ncbi:hypothetical protein C8N25_109148 [Algoriphagus antarcticus]|uniref:Uncharacterized protein n=1 Tax=Algoriphagus antarcticus TaxID=238540 RepID=A0A3E0DX12_9BACT|nr:hypothetical protein C8N25_109148 [Algoriphagus antarcticus]